MDQNIESKILEKRKLCKVLKVFKIVSFIGIFAPFVAFMVVSRNGYELDSAWLLIPALFVGGFSCSHIWRQINLKTSRNSWDSMLYGVSLESACR